MERKLLMNLLPMVTQFLYLLSATYTVTYQPEDRYSMISEANSTSTPATTGETDTNNFITITTTLADPHIHFYTSDDGTGTEIGTFTPSGTTDGISLAYTKVNGNDVTAHQAHTRFACREMQSRSRSPTVP